MVVSYRWSPVTHEEKVNSIDVIHLHMISLSFGSSVCFYLPCTFICLVVSIFQTFFSSKFFEEYFLSNQLLIPNFSFSHQHSFQISFRFPWTIVCWVVYLHISTDITPIVKFIIQCTVLYSTFNIYVWMCIHDGGSCFDDQWLL